MRLNFHAAELVVLNTRCDRILHLSAEPVSVEIVGCTLSVAVRLSVCLSGFLKSCMTAVCMASNAVADTAGRQLTQLHYTVP